MGFTYRALVDGYFRIRRQSETLKADSVRFEALPWTFRNRVARRTNGGFDLMIYKSEGSIEVCISAPDGSSKTYS